MPSIFELAVRKASTAMDGVFGRPLRFIPKQGRDNYGKSIGAADGRVQIDLIGGLVDGSIDFEFLAGDKRSSNFTTQSVNFAVRASIARQRFPEGNAPKKGDIIQTLDEVPAVAYEIVGVFPDGPSRWALPLVRAT